MSIVDSSIRLLIVGVVAATLYALGALPPEPVPSVLILVTTALLSFGAWLAVPPKQRRRKTGLVLLVAAGLACLSYAVCLDRLTFAYPPGQTTAVYVAGTHLTAEAVDYQRGAGISNVSQTVAAFGGLNGVELVWSSGALAAAKLVLGLSLAGTIAGLASTLLYLLPPLAGTMSGNSVESSSNVLPVFRILVLAANPVDTDRLALDREIKAIRQRLLNAKAADKLQLEAVGALEASELTDSLLAHRPSVVHFSGHGGEDGRLVVEDASGNSLPLDQQRLARLFAILGDRIRCVVLNACFSEEQGRLIAEHVPCVVGMSAAVADDSAIAFSGQFYSALAFGESVKVAFDLACNQVALNGLPGAETPQLMTQPGVDAAQVRLLPKPE